MDKLVYEYIALISNITWFRYRRNNGNVWM